MRSIEDYSTIDSNSLYYDVTAQCYAGDSIANGVVIENEYYHAAEDITDEPVYVIPENSAHYFSILGLNTDTLNERGKQIRSYIDNYGGFFMVKKLEELRRTAEILNTKQCDRCAILLAGEISNVSANGAMFGTSMSHPFRGVFDGNGYAVHINQIYITQRSNGLFGYIAEEGIVRNLVLTDSITNVGSLPVSVNCSQYISLETIKFGLGDVTFGLLAGVNNGFCENVVVSANIDFAGRLRPNVYFTHNKTLNDEDIGSLISDVWNIIDVDDQYDYKHAKDLSNYANFCYPTQLCLNSEANLIPYVGYFNEGLYAEASVKSPTKPLYEYPMSGKSTYAKNGKSTYCADIYEVYEKYCDAAGDDYSVKHTSEDIMQKGSFRLGPCNKAAYVFGGVFGTNNGYCKDIGYSGKLTFNDNFVGLVGGFCRKTS